MNHLKKHLSKGCEPSVSPIPTSTGDWQSPLPCDEGWKGETYLILSLWNKSVSLSSSVAWIILNMEEQLLVLAHPHSLLLCISTFWLKKCKVNANLSCFLLHSLHILISCCLVSFSSVLQRSPLPGFSPPATGDAFCVYYPGYSDIIQPHWCTCVSARPEYSQHSHMDKVIHLSTIS